MLIVNYHCIYIHNHENSFTIATDTESIIEKAFTLKLWAGRQTLSNPVMMESLPLQKQHCHIEHQ